jgi:hypothetical protein
MKRFIVPAAAALIAALTTPASADVIGDRLCGCHWRDVIICHERQDCFSPCVEDVELCNPMRRHPCGEYRLDCAPRYRAQ